MNRKVSVGGGAAIRVNLHFLGGEVILVNFHFLGGAVTLVNIRSGNLSFFFLIIFHPAVFQILGEFPALLSTHISYMSN